jgi:hypothetical protein
MNLQNTTKDVRSLGLVALVVSIRQQYFWKFRPAPIEHSNVPDALHQFRGRACGKRVQGDVADLAVADARAHLDEFVVGERAVQLMDHGVGESGVAEHDDWRQGMGETAQMFPLSFGQAHPAQYIRILVIASQFVAAAAAAAFAGCRCRPAPTSLFSLRLVNNFGWPARAAQLANNLGRAARAALAKNLGSAARAARLVNNLGWAARAAWLANNLGGAARAAR